MQTDMRFDLEDSVRIADNNGDPLPPSFVVTGFFKQAGHPMASLSTPGGVYKTQVPVWRLRHTSDAITRLAKLHDSP